MGEWWDFLYPPMGSGLNLSGQPVGPGPWTAPLPKHKPFGLEERATGAEDNAPLVQEPPSNQAEACPFPTENSKATRWAPVGQLYPRSRQSFQFDKHSQFLQ